MNVSDRKSIAGKYFGSDNRFNRLFPEPVRLLAARHWTPLAVARKAASFLAADKGKRILDIGSGAGKFCLAAAYFTPNADFFGIEHRNDLVEYAQEAAKKLELKNVSFTHGNFTQLDLRNYDHIYFFNAFYENIANPDTIDKRVERSDELYHLYHRHMFRQLEQMPEGTRLATYYGHDTELPAEYHVVGTAMDSLLKFWIKI